MQRLFYLGKDVKVLNGAKVKTVKLMTVSRIVDCINERIKVIVKLDDKLSLAFRTWYTGS